MASLGHPSKFQRVSRLGGFTARHSSSGRQPNFAKLNRGRHLYSAGRPSRWALAHILVFTVLRNIGRINSLAIATIILSVLSSHVCRIQWRKTCNRSVCNVLLRYAIKRCIAICQLQLVVREWLLITEWFSYMAVPVCRLLIVSNYSGFGLLLQPWQFVVFRKMWWFVESGSETRDNIKRYYRCCYEAIYDGVLTLDI